MFARLSGFARTLVRLCSHGVRLCSQRDTILLIEDDEAMRTMLSCALERSGYDVVAVHDGRAGLVVLSSRHADLVITDLIMPEIDGIELLVWLSRRPRKIPVIAISGGGKLPAGGYLDIARACGASRVLSKPFELQALLRSIEELLQRQASGAVEGP